MMGVSPLCYALRLANNIQELFRTLSLEARRGLAEATPRTQNVLAQGQSEAHGDSKLYNQQG